MKTTTKQHPQVMNDGPAKDGSVAKERIAFLLDKACRVKVWWTVEAQMASPAGDEFVAILCDCIPIGRDYYFVFKSIGDNPKRSIIKTAAVLMMSEEGAPHVR